MAIYEVTYYHAKCDGCGYVATDTDGYNTYAAWPTPDDVKDVLDSIDWIVDDSATLCPDCQPPTEEVDYDVHGDVDE